MNYNPSIRLRVLPSLLPVDGREVEFRTTEDFIQWRYVPDHNGEPGWVDLIAIADLVGPQGPSLELRVNAGNIEWSVQGAENWVILTSLEDITGPEGPEGPEGPAGPGLTDGDKGDMTVSDDGEAWSYNDNSLTRPKLFTHFERILPLGLWEFGATGNDNEGSLVDETAAIVSAITQASAQRRKLVIPGTNYLWGGINLTGASNVYLEGDHVGRPVFFGAQAFADAGGRLFRFNRAAYDVAAGVITVPGDIVPNQKKVTLSSVSGLAVGMALDITSSALWYYDNRGTETKGETHLITRVLEGTNQVEFRDYTRDFYDVSEETVSVRAYWPDRLEIAAMRVIMPPPATAVSTCCFQTDRHLEARMDDVSMEGATFCGWLRGRGFYTRTQGLDIRNIGHSGGVGYGISDRGGLGSRDYGTHGQSMRRLIDYHSGAGIVARDGLFKDFEMYGGGVEFDGSEYYPDGSVQDYGVGMHGPCENARFVDGIISGVMEGVKVRGRNTEVSGVRFLGRMISCIAATFGTGLIVNDNSYERVDYPNKIAQADLNNDAQAQNFIKYGVTAGTGNWGWGAPTVVTKNTANGLRDSFEFFGSGGGTIAASNHVCTDNFVLARPPTGSTFSFYKVEGTTRVGFSKLGPNTLVNGGAGSALMYPGAGSFVLANTSQMGSSSAVELGDGEYTITIPDDAYAVIWNASKQSNDRIVIQISDNTGNVFGHFILLNATSSTTALGAVSSSIVATASGSTLNGTTGADGNFTLGLTDGNLYMENRTNGTRRVRIKIS